MMTGVPGSVAPFFGASEDCSSPATVIAFDSGADEVVGQAMQDELWPNIGDKVTFRSPVYVETTDGIARLEAATFVFWVESVGDVVAVIQTPYGDGAVRWSMIEGIDSPEGLLDR